MGKADKEPLIDWSWLRWRWSGLEILMIVGIVVTLGAVSIMLWGTLQDYWERGPAIGGGAATGSRGEGVPRGHSRPSGE